MRVVTWNLQHLHGDRGAVARVIRDAEPDLVCIQEGPRWPVISAWSLRRLAREAGLHVVGGGWRAAGNAILRSSRVRADDVVTLRFPLAHWFGQRRGSVLCTATVDDGSAARVACVHLGLDHLERERHVTGLVARLRPAGPRVIVAGDLNEATGGPSWVGFAQVATDPAPGAPVTFSVVRPRLRIDAVLTGPGITVVEYARWQARAGDAAKASDHLPVRAVVQ